MQKMHKLWVLTYFNCLCFHISNLHSSYFYKAKYVNENKSFAPIQMNFLHLFFEDKDENDMNIDIGIFATPKAEILTKLFEKNI